MFVRIKKQMLSAANSSGKVSGDYSVRVLIVESYRHKGKPRQRIIKYLGSTKKNSLRTPEQKQRFLDEMKGKIDLMEEELSYKERVAVKLSLIRAIYRSVR